MRNFSSLYSMDVSTSSTSFDLRLAHRLVGLYTKSSSSYAADVDGCGCRGDCGGGDDDLNLIVLKFIDVLLIRAWIDVTCSTRTLSCCRISCMNFCCFCSLCCSCFCVCFRRNSSNFCWPIRSSSCSNRCWYKSNLNIDN